MIFCILKQHFSSKFYRQNSATVAVAAWGGGGGGRGVWLPAIVHKAIHDRLGVDIDESDILKSFNIIVH